jgi:hypothetical protein
MIRLTRRRGCPLSFTERQPRLDRVADGGAGAPELLARRRIPTITMRLIMTG